MPILGISAFYHDSAAAIVDDGEIVAAAQEERFTRKKHDPSFPKNAIEYCLSECRCTVDDLDYVAFYDKPFLKFERLLQTYVSSAPRGFQSFRMAIPIWVREKLFQKGLLARELRRLGGDRQLEDRMLFTEHHQSHAASAFFPSPFDEAAVLTLDGVGEWATTSVAIGRGRRLEVIKEQHFPHSLGLLYAAFTYHTGFKVNSGEYKVMGLAPYGEPRYADLIFEHLVDLKDDGTFRLDQSYFNYCTGLTMTGPKFDDLFGGPPRRPGEQIRQRDMDLAASVQKATEEIVLRLTRSLAREAGLSNLCMAGGVALNCVANGAVLRDGAFRNIWIQPAAGDAGGALGAALCAHHWFLGNPRSTQNGRDLMRGALLGPGFPQEEVERRLTAASAVYETLLEQDLIERTVDALVAEKAVGWHQGRMEFGPRALGARSILADPRSVTMQRDLNLKVKFRESFRPFAPAILREEVAEWFSLDGVSPYMLLVADVLEEHRTPLDTAQRTLFGIERLNTIRSDIPAVTHVDYSARIQTVDAETNSLFHRLISAFKRRTGCPLLVNTSFNVRGEPIVNTPEDAFRCFMGTGLDVLSIGNCILYKERQDPALGVSYAQSLEPD